MPEPTNVTEPLAPLVPEAPPFPAIPIELTVTVNMDEPQVRWLVVLASE